MLIQAAWNVSLTYTTPILHKLTNDCYMYLTTMWCSSTSYWMTVMSNVLWLWVVKWFVIFLSKANIWNVNCARATTFIFDTQTGVLVKVSKFWDRKCLNLKGTRTPNLRIHAECSNLLSYQGQTFAVPCFITWQDRYFWSKVNIWNVNCARATAFIHGCWWPSNARSQGISSHGIDAWYTCPCLPEKRI